MVRIYVCDVSFHCFASLPAKNNYFRDTCVSKLYFRVAVKKKPCIVGLFGFPFVSTQHAVTVLDTWRELWSSLQIWLGTSHGFK